MTTPVLPHSAAAGDGGADEGEPAEGSGRAVLRRVGLEPIIDFLETTAYGVCITGAAHEWVYLNPAAERTIGHRLADVAGCDYTLQFAEHEREVLLALEADQRQGDTEFYTNTVVRPDGSEVEMTWSGTVIEIDGVEVAPAIFHETTPVRSAQRSAAELAGAAAHGERSEVLDHLVREVTRDSRAVAAALLLEDPAGALRVLASSGTGPGLADAVAGSGVMLSDLPGTEDLARGRSVFYSDARQRLRARERTAAWKPLLSTSPWGGAVLVGVRCDGRLAGLLLVALPESLTSPSESEVAFWSSLADQMGVTLGAERIREHTQAASALTERNRIARDLHDSVSQALFSLHARAQVVRRALDADDRSLALEAAADLEQLSRQATAELRELVSQLRPAEDRAVDVAPALRRLADEVDRIDGLPVEVSFSPATLPLVPPRLAEHLPRIVREALHNSVKHARATRASIRVAADRDAVVVEVRDDGRGFDAADRYDGFGQRTMRERAALCGGSLAVTSVPGSGSGSGSGSGTTVTLHAPLT